MDYFDLGTNLQALVNTIYDENGQSSQGDGLHPSHHRHKPVIDKSFYQVRQSVCVAGVNGDAIREVKSRIAGLMGEPLVALESFHVRSPQDLSDGAFLVPKVVLVAAHCPGKKVIDDDEDLGQLDRLYDEACDVGADIMLVYMGLPHSIYPPMTHIIYHPKMEDMVFMDQPLLRHLASQNCFLTICDGCDLNALQKNVLKEWLVRPVKPDHPVYSAADQMCADAKCPEPRPVPHSPDVRSGAAILPDVVDVGYEPSTEEHPLADKKKEKKKKRKFGFKSRRRGDAVKSNWGGNSAKGDSLTPVRESGEEDCGLEMEMYRSEATAIRMEVGSSAVL